MRHTMRVAASLASLTPIYAAGAPVAHAETTTCAGTIGAVTLDNVVVQDDTACTLQGTRLKGTIYVMTRATLNANMVRVNGNIQAEGARSVFVNPRSRVDGNIQIKQGLGAKVDGGANRRRLASRAKQQTYHFDQESNRRQPASLPEYRWAADFIECHRRKPTVQGEQPAANRWK